MASDESWHLRDIAPEIRETAREAARREGISVDQWLQSLIVDSAQQPRAKSAARKGPAPSAALNDRLDALNEQLDRLSKTGVTIPAAATMAQTELADSLRAIEGRLDDLGRSATPFPPTEQLLDVLARLNQRLDRLMDGEGETQRPIVRPRSPSRSESEAAPISDAPETAGADTPAEGGWPNELDLAIAEIAARQRELGFEAQPAGRMQPPPAPSAAAPIASVAAAAAPPHARPLSGLAELQGRLDHLSEELRVLREPGGLADQVRAMREELAQISRAMAQAAPRRVLEALEGEVHALVERIDKGRRIGADPAALSSLESMLNELRELIHAMTPAESLSGVRDDVRALDRKIELIGAQGLNTAGLPQLQRAVADLREVASRAATGEALIALAEEVQALGDRIDRYIGANPIGDDLLATLDKRFQAFASDLNARGVPAGAPGVDDLVAIVEALSNKINAMEIGSDSLPTLEGIVQHLTGLTDRIEASGARLDQIENIERSFAVLLERVDGLRNEAVEAAERVARETIAAHGGRAPSSGADVDALRQNLDVLRENQQRSDRRTQDTLEAMHDTLERFVDRLAALESSMHGDDAPRSASPRHLDPIQAPAIAPAAPDARVRPAAAPPAPVERKPIDPSLPADYPLEPGAARARPSATAAERIAASEAALGAAKPAQSPPADAKANFIAAARRAAQAAASMSTETGDAAEPLRPERSAFGSFTEKLRGRRPVVLAVALLIGSTASYLTLHGLPFDLSGGAGPAPARTTAAKDTPAKDQSEVARPKVQIADLPQRPVETVTIAKPSDPETPVARTEAEPPAGSAAAAPEDAGSPDATASTPQPPRRPSTGTVPTVSPLTLAAIQLPVGDVTGSLGRATGVTPNAGSRAPAAAATAAAPAVPEALPARLRAAAAAGDAKAEYEIATRYAEGRGVPQNMQEAAAWFERAAVRDLAPAQYRLGGLYEKGQGVKKDIDQARRLYRAAADGGNAKAMHNLAVLYAEGVEGKPDFRLSAHWFRKASQHGVADSQYNLGVLYARGLGVEQNLSESYKWFALAAQQGDKEAGKKRDEIAARLDPTATIAARLAVQTFSAEAQPDEAVTVAAPPGGWDAPAERGSGKARSGAPAPRKNGS